MSEGRLLNGQLLLREKLGSPTVPYTEQMSDKTTGDEAVGDAATEVTPSDRGASMVRVFDFDALGDQLDTIFLRVPGMTNIQFPFGILESITVTFNSSAQDGESVIEAGSAEAEGTSGSLLCQASASAQGSAACIPDLQANISEIPSTNIPVENLFFYMSGNTTRAAVITKIETLLTVGGAVVAGVVTTASDHNLVANQPFKFATATGGVVGIVVGTIYFVKVVNNATSFTYSATAGGAALTTHAATSATLFPTITAWPTFRPQSHTFTLVGQQISVSANAESRFAENWSSESKSVSIKPFGGSRADGRSGDVGLTVKTLRFPPTIHPAIVLPSPSSTVSGSVTVKANLPPIWNTNNGIPTFPALLNQPAPINFSAVGSIFPTSIAATSPSTIPTSGLYLLSLDFDLPQFNYSTVHAVLVNMSYFA